MKKKTIAITTAAALLAGALVAFNSLTLSSGDSYRPDRDTRARMGALAPELKGSRTHLGSAWKERRDGAILLYMEGSPYEMGYQHGALLREEIHSGVVPAFSDPVGHTLEHRNKPAWLRRLLTKYLEIAVYAPIERHTPREYLEELKGIADGCGIPYREVFIANFKSDLTMVMASRMIPAKARELPAECSSFAAAAPFTPDGELVFGRNTDYAGQGRWMKNQVIFFYKPRGGHAYVRVDTAGLLKCNTAMNEHGIVVGGHFMAYEGARASGASFTVLENEIMRRAKNLDEAVAIVRRAPVCGSFGLAVADGNTRTAVAIEAVGETVGVQPMEQRRLILANCATTRELKALDLMARHNLVMRDLFGRMVRIDSLLVMSQGSLTPARAAEILGDHYDIIVRRERATGITVGAANNVTSAVFLPARGRFWVATGDEPACGNRYAGFDLAAELSGKPSDVQPRMLDGYRWNNPSHERGLRAYMLAYALFEENPNELVGILAHLDRACAEDPHEPVYDEMAARLLMHAGRYMDAMSRISESLRPGQSSAERALRSLLMGQCLDLMDRREEALAFYDRVISLHREHGSDHITGVNEFTAALARAYRIKPFTKNSIDDVQIGFGQETGLE
jgi:isopenicillin-N N-acyltransferase like protein